MCSNEGCLITKTIDKLSEIQKAFEYHSAEYNAVQEAKMALTNIMETDMSEEFEMYLSYWGNNQPPEIWNKWGVL